MFVKHLQEHSAVFERSVDCINQSTSGKPGIESAQIAAIIDRSHRLSGVAGTFGEHELTEMARNLEVFLSENVEPDLSDLGLHLNRLIDKISTVIEHHQ